jgi:hypothetical protein
MKIVKNMAFWSVTLLMLSGCMSSLYSDRDSNYLGTNMNVGIPQYMDGLTLFTRNMYENIARNAANVQLYVENDAMFVRSTSVKSKLLVKDGNLVANYRGKAAKILLGANTPVIISKAENPEFLDIDTGGKRIKFMNYQLNTALAKDYLGSGKNFLTPDMEYINNAGGLYLPEACFNQDKVQMINKIPYVLVTPCNARLLVRVVQDKANGQVVKLKGEKYRKLPSKRTRSQD